MAILRQLPAWLLVMAAVATAAAQAPTASPTKAAPRPPASAIHLEIPDTGQEARRPDSGWCGEAAIQMAMSHYGAYASQQTINRAGKPVHPDLYEEDIPVALKNLGLESHPWKGDGLQAFLNWVRTELTAGHPVLLGVKIYPTAHPEWALDHFVLAVGCADRSLTYNTTWGRQETRSFDLLSSQDKGISLVNRYHSYFGYSITGLTTRLPPPDLVPTRIDIGQAGGNKVELRITVEGLQPGKQYRLLKFTDLAAARQPDAAGELLRSFRAEKPCAVIDERIDRDDTRVYRCLPAR